MHQFLTRLRSGNLLIYCWPAGTPRHISHLKERKAKRERAGGGRKRGKGGERERKETEREEKGFLTKYRVTINDFFGRECFWKRIKRI